LRRFDRRPIEVTIPRGSDALLSEIRRLAAEVGRTLGLEIVEATFHRAPGGGALRVTIDAPGVPGVAIEDCQRFSGALERLLDEHDVIEGSYVLEVSSPGIDRPIESDDDVRRNTGRRVEIDTREPVGGSRALRGVLLGLEGDSLRLRSDDGADVSVPRTLIARARQEMGVRPQEKPGKRPRRRG
jgi:ribosome maturation factor RimP